MRWAKTGFDLAVDLLELDGADLRALSLGERKAKLARLVDRRQTWDRHK